MCFFYQTARTSCSCITVRNNWYVDFSFPLVKDLEEFLSSGVFALVVADVVGDPVPGDGSGQDLLRDVKGVQKDETVGSQIGAVFAAEVLSLKS